MLIEGILYARHIARDLEYSNVDPKKEDIYQKGLLVANWAHI